MPEGHLLHRLAHEVTDLFGDHRVESSSPQGRFGSADLLNGSILTGAQTWGKHLFVGFDSTDALVHVHLGIYGKMKFEPGVPPVVGEVRWRISDGATTADLRGPAACELLDPPEVTAILNRLGPDPLRSQSDPEAFISRVLRSRAPIATLLMDQSVIAGTGNIYRAEVLFRHGINPITPGKELSRSQVEAIWADMVALMSVGFDRGRIDTVRPEHEPEAMGRPPREDAHGGEVYVYRREGQPCWVCGSPILMTTVGSRNLFWCPTCQTGGGR